MPPKSCKTMVAVLRHWAEERAERNIYTFLLNGEVESECLSYGELDTRARAIAARLQALGVEGERALLLYPAGLDFIAAFFGCLYAGVTAVPAYPPHRHRVQQRLQSIIADCQPAVSLTTSAIAERADVLNHQSDILAKAHWLATDHLTDLDTLAQSWRPSDISTETLAFLQYTSGSTGSPKGVMVSHANLLHNEEMIRLAFGQDETSVVVGWLPLYHDMGLIGNVLQPLYAGARCVLMSPMAFLQKPLRWLAAIDKYRGTTSGGPNFAYELCVERVGEEERAKLDLSSWRVGFTGAEPVRATTLERFTATFASQGFRREVFYPCYGLAETTLLVSGGDPHREPLVRTYDTAQLELDRAVPPDGGGSDGRTLVGCGRAWLGQQIAIVDPTSCRRKGAGLVGEIWVRGASIAAGYWQQPEASRRDFAAHIVDEAEAGSFLRTGDLGFLDGGELFVNGRLKDLIIIRGRNLYPHDLEHTAETSHPGLRAGCSAAFGLDEDNQEHLVLVLEVSRAIARADDRALMSSIIAAVRQALAEEHQVAAKEVVLISPGTLPKTSSGKIRHRSCRQQYRSGALSIVASSAVADATEANTEANTEATTEATTRTTEPIPTRGAQAEGETRLVRQDLLALGVDEQREVLVAHLQQLVVGRLGLPAGHLPIDRPLTASGLDSLHAMELQGRLETDFGRGPDLADLLDGATLGDLANTLLEGLAEGGEEPFPSAGAMGKENPLSHNQMALWFLHRLAPQSAAYNIAAAARIHGHLDTEALGRAFAQLVDRHPMLRSRFHDPHGEPIQEILPPAADRFLLHREEARGWDEARLEEHLATAAHRPFRLAEEPLLRVLLLHRADDEHLLLLVVHHLVADFWSIAILLEELGEIYRQEAGGARAALRPLTHTYADFVLWQRQYMAGDQGKRLENYWLDALGGAFEPLDLATDRPRPAIQTWNGASASTFLPSSLEEGLTGSDGEFGATSYMVLLAAFEVLLHCYSGQQNILVGSPTAGRGRAEFENLVGYFVNPLVMRGNFHDDPTWSVFLRRMRSTVLAALRHQDYPFERLVERLHPERGTNRPPIFQVLFTLQQAPRLRAEGLDAFALGGGGGSLTLGGLEWESLAIATRTAQFELSLTAAVTKDGIALNLSYNLDLFEALTAERLLGHLGRVVEAVAENPEVRLSTLDLLTPGERSQILTAWNATQAPYPPETSLHRMVEAQAQRTPEGIALVMGEVAFSYRQLLHRAAQLAGHLRSLGVELDEPVGIFVERSPQMILGILGILQAGGCYLPLDPSYPEDRLLYMFSNATHGRERRLLVTRESDRHRLGRLATAATQLVVLDGDLGVDHTENRAQRVSPHPENLAYLIYTSGSTGQPKGVELAHRSVVNFLASMLQQPGLAASDTLLAVTTLAFDIAVLEIFLPLVVGARLVLASREIAADGRRLGEQIVYHRVSMMQATPATWRLLLESAWGGAPDLVMLSGGEALPADLAARLLACGAALWNMYGPTETTIWSAVRQVHRGERPTRVGGAIANTHLHILGKHLEALPVGVPGDMWIAGDGLARGYHDRPRLTAERFLPHPFTAEVAATPGGRMYHVGDRVRWRDDGTFEFLGRSDHQVKVRGYRIELGEIESALAKHPAITQAVVVVHGENSADPRLWACWQAVDRGAVPSASELRDFLRRGLPDYMVPSAFLRVDTFPQTPNGKIDRKALARRPFPTASADGERRPPGSRVERLLATLWCEVLEVETVGLDDNFFDLGGHSLLATRLHRLLVERLGRDDLQVIHLFQYPTIESMTRFLGAQEDPQEAPVRRPPAPAHDQEIAIIGMAGRFPGAPDIKTFWHNLRQGIESITFFGEDQLDDVDVALRENPNYVRARGVLDGGEDFDASFFGFTPREAEVMDPQHRVFLEVAYEALEDAGHDPSREPGRVGLYAGVGMNTYLLHAGEQQLAALAGGYQAFIANDKDFVPTRVSYKLGLRGPSVSIQTACSSSLVAVHLACQALRMGEAEMALAGGVTIRLPQRQGYLYEAGGILSADGHCRAFDEEAGGTVLGSGLGLVVLKPLAAARKHGDRVLAVIKGSAINNDGSLKMGYTAPSVEGQAEVITTALERAGIEAHTVGYVEAHGTGTALGDPIEVTALRQAYGSPSGSTASAGTASSQTDPCFLGSVKTNIGHLDCAAGIAGLIKTVLTLDRGEIPPSLHFARPNAKIPFAGGPFQVASTLRPWPRGSAPRRAAVSSFGIGGTNAHLVLEEAPTATTTSTKTTTPSLAPQLLVWSAKTPTALDAMTRRLAEDLATVNIGTDIADVAFTLHSGRRIYDHRRWVVVEDHGDALKVLSERPPERLRTGHANAAAARRRSTAETVGRPTGTLQQARREVTFLFSGQGSQYPGMGHQLYTSEPLFQEAIDRSAEILEPELGLDLRHLLYPPSGQTEAAARQLRDTRFTQPALFVVGYALAQLWRAWGVSPTAMIGHSIGELLAATLAGVFPFEDALRLVTARGRLMQELPPGSMLAIGLSEAEIQPLLDQELSLAVINGPQDCVVAGPQAAVNALHSRLAGTHGTEEEPIRLRLLHTSHAFHSAMMRPAVEPFVHCVAQLDLKPPRIPFISNVTGSWIRDEEATDPAYWGRHLAEPVRFADGLRTLAAGEEQSVFLEVGPGRTLATLLRGQIRDRTVVASLPHSQDPEDARRFLLGALGHLWQAGVTIDWQGFYRHRGEQRGEQRSRVALPTYPFERRRFWLERAKEHSALASASDPLEKKAAVGDWLYGPVWKPAHAAKAPAGSGQDEVWWILGDQDSTESLAGRLQLRLAATGRQVTRTAAGANLRQHLASFAEPPHRIVVLWPAERRATTHTPTNTAEQEQFGLATLLRLIQAVADLPGETPIGLDLVTRGVWRVGSEATAETTGALLWGLLRAVPQELPRLRVRAVDLELVEDCGPRALDDDLDDLLLEVVAAVSAPTEVAWRGGLRFERTFAPLPLPTVDQAASRLVPGGTYLITGGLGDVGLTLARGIVEGLPPTTTGVRARLALLGRSGLPAPHTWDTVLSTSADPHITAVQRKIRAIRQLEAAGAEVMTVTADVADPQALAAAVAEVSERLGPIRGVLHGAGIAGGGLLRLRRMEEIEAVLRPKVAGTRVLLDALTDQPLDFVVFCSSINAVVGGYGQADYCAANAFLDATAAARGGGRRGPLLVSLGWDRWHGLGMAAALPGASTANGVTAHGATHPLLGSAVVSTAEREIYRAHYSVAEHWVLSEHQIAGHPTVPGATYLEMARAAFAGRAAGRPLEIREVVFLEPLTVDHDRSLEVLTVFDFEPPAADRAQGPATDREATLGRADLAASFRILSRLPEAGDPAEKTPWSLHCRGRIQLAAPRSTPPVDLAAVRRRTPGRITAEDAKERSSRGFLVTGRRWEGLESVGIGEGEMLAEIVLAEDLSADLETFQLHPALLDIAVGCVQLSRSGDFLPLSYERLYFHGPLPRRLTSHLRLRGKAEDAITCDALLVDEHGLPQVEIEGFSMRRLAKATIAELEGATARPTTSRPSAAGHGKRRPEDVVLEGTIEAAEAIEVLHRVLASRVPPHLVVSPRDLGAVAAAYRAFDPSQLMAEMAAIDSPASGQTRPDLGIEFVAPEEGLEKILAEVWRRYLGIDDIGVHDNFFELGGSSLVGVQVVEELKRRLGREISTVSLFEAPTIAAMAKLLEPPAAAGEAFAETRSRASKKKAALRKTTQALGPRTRRKR